MDHYYPSYANGSAYGVLEVCLKDILSSIRPLDTDRVKRLKIINELATLVQSVESLRDAVIKPFGSFVSNLDTIWGDLDISVEMSHNPHSPTVRKRKQQLLQELVRALRRAGTTYNLKFIPNARVPLLIFTTKAQHVSCDVSVDNYLGHIKSKFLLWITDIDERFRDMVLLTKEWAKKQSINDPKSGTLNSFSLCLLVIFHFQTCKPAILPPLKEIYEGNINGDLTGMRFITERHIEEVCAANIVRFKSRSLHQRNKSSLSQLLVSFFEKFSGIETLSSEYAICTFTGQYERIASNPQWMEKSYSLFIEDPFEQPDNAARAVGLRELCLISNAFRDAYQKFSRDSVLRDRNYMLPLLVRSSISSKLEVRTQNGYTGNEGSKCQHVGVVDSVFCAPMYQQSHGGHTANEGSRRQHAAGVVDSVFCAPMYQQSHGGHTASEGSRRQHAAGVVDSVFCAPMYQQSHGGHTANEGSRRQHAAGVVDSVFCAPPYQQSQSKHYTAKEGSRHQHAAGVVDSAFLTPTRQLPQSDHSTDTGGSKHQLCGGIVDSVFLSPTHQQPRSDNSQRWDWSRPSSASTSKMHGTETIQSQQEWRPRYANR